MKQLSVALSVSVICVAALSDPPLRAQSGTILAPTDNLVVEGVPAIPITLVADVRRYTEFRAATLLDWHPGRREMLIATRFGNAPQIHHVKMPGGARTQLTFLDEPINVASYEPRDGNSFVFRRDEGGNEFWQLYRYDFADGRVTLLTDGGRSQNTLGAWSNGSGRMAYTSTRRNGTDRDIYVMNPLNTTSDGLVLEVQGGGWSVLDWSPDDGQLLLREGISISESRLYAFDLTTRLRTELTPRGAESVAYQTAAFSADGRGLYLTTDQGSEFLRLAYLNIATKQVTPITTSITWDVERSALSRNRKRLAFSVNEAGMSKLYLLDTDTNRYSAINGLPVAVLSGASWHNNGRDLGLTFTSARSVADVYSVDVETRQISRWTESELGGLNQAELSDPTLIKWTSFDGREITGFYYRPPARFTGRRPVIVNIHGGPEGQSRPTFLGRHSYLLNELGVAMIFPNVRGSTGYGKTFVNLDNGMKREDSVKDIGTLVDWIGRQSELDAMRILVTGVSYGGYMTLAVATHYNDRICCALDVVGISDFNSFFKNTEAYRRDLRRVEYGDERDPKIAEFFKRIAPLNNASRISKPLFVVAGGNDPRVPHTESEQMVVRVRQNQGPVWYLMAKDEGHGFQKKANVDFQFYATVMFVKAHLLEEEKSVTR